MRKQAAKKLPLAPDAKFNDTLVTRFINCMMWDGKKSTAQRIFYDALDKITKDTSVDGYETWKTALANVTPEVEVRSKRIGGSTFQIPMEVRQDRKISLSIKWIIKYSRCGFHEPFAFNARRNSQKHYKHKFNWYNFLHKRNYTSFRKVKNWKNNKFFLISCYNWTTRRVSICCCKGWR